MNEKKNGLASFFSDWTRILKITDVKEQIDSPLNKTARIGKAIQKNKWSFGSL